MISAKLMGGLGNQMFQISCAASLAINNNDKFAFDFDNCFTPNQGHVSSKYKNTIYKKISDLKNFQFSSIYIEPKFSYKKINFQKNLLLQGYFQSEKYFVENKSYITDLFYFDSTIFEFIKNKLDFNFEDTTCVQVRRGDYLKFQNIHMTCGLEYFESAISMTNTKNYIFISDDTDWIKSNFKKETYFCSELGDEVLDFCLMMMCKNVIISNSSFGWWGAYLNKNINKKIISPKKWFNSQGPQDYGDVIPNEWIKI